MIKKIKSLENTYFSWNDELMKWSEDSKLHYMGYNRMDAPKGLSDIQEWTNGSYTVFRSGIYSKNDKDYGYIQLFSYTNDKLKLVNSEHEVHELSYRSPVLFRNFVKELKEKGIPLIVDLRVNFGGNSAIAIENLASIAKVGDVYPSRTVAFRTTQFYSIFI